MTRRDSHERGRNAVALRPAFGEMPDFADAPHAVIPEAVFAHGTCTRLGGYVRAGVARIGVAAGRRTGVTRYATAALLVAGAGLLEAALWPWVQPTLSPLFTAAVMFAALYAGFGPALLATVLAAVASAFFFFPPVNSLSVGGDDALRAVVFVVVATACSSAAAGRRRAEAGLRVALAASERADRGKERVLAVLAHELRNPLSPMLAIASDLAARNSLPADVRDDVRTIERNVELLVRLIDDLLDASRAGSGKLTLRRERVDLHALLRNVAGPSGSRGDVDAPELVFDLAADSHVISGDATRLSQVFANLVGNARKFTPAGGTVTIRTRDLAEPQPSVVVTVADTGIGIEPHALARIFEPFEQGDAFTTARFGGLGLGLSIARAVVDAHGGALAARSDGRGRGASFSVSLPQEHVPGDVPTSFRLGELPAPPANS